MKILNKLPIVLASLLALGVAHADVTIGVSLPLTGPTSALGIPCQNGVKLWPATVGGEKLNATMLTGFLTPPMPCWNSSTISSISPRLRPAT